MRGFYDFDKILCANAPFKRYPSITATGLNPWETIYTPNADIEKNIKTFEQEIKKLMLAKFKLPQLTRSDMGQLINVDEAFEGVPECYRHVRETKPVLKLGLNLSAAYWASNAIHALRGGAIIALYNLVKSRGQNVQIDICYGMGLTHGSSKCHLRITLGQNISNNLIARLMTPRFRESVSDVITDSKLGAYGDSYRLHEFKAAYGWNEFDFALDRIETDDIEVEKARIYKAIEKLK